MLSSVEVLNAFLTYLQLTVDLSGWNAIINRGKSIQLDTLSSASETLIAIRILWYLAKIVILEFSR